MRKTTAALALGVLLVSAPAFALGPPATPDQPSGGWTGTGNGGGSGTANPSWFDTIPPNEGEEFQDWQEANDSHPDNSIGGNGSFGSCAGDNC